MARKRLAPVATACALAAAATLPGALHAQIALVDGGNARLTLGGYVRALTGIHDLGYEIPESPFAAATPRRSGFHGEVIRLKWQLEGGRGGAGGGASWRIDVHNRLQARVSSAPVGGQVVGFGVSTVPARLLDLETVWVDEPGLRAWHDLDRLSLTVNTDVADITVGRQAITWGVSGIFPVADLWARFSPFELDTEEKPGIDAVRVLAYPAPGLELDAVVADRGSARNLSTGVRATWSLADADVWLGVGKFWRELIAMGGITVLLDQARLRAEAALPRDLHAGRYDEPRVTVGFDWLRGTLVVTGEYHFNGIGSAPASYIQTLNDPRVRRGETYYIGRHYVGAMVAWSPDRDNRLNLALNALTNAVDPSAALTPLLSYDVGQAARVALGALVSFGQPPAFTGLPELPTEFGAYGTLGFTQVSIYF